MKAESNSGKPVIVIGDEIANSLFGGFEVLLVKKLDCTVRKFTVIGVVKKEGSGLFGDSNDVSVFLPANFVRNRYGDNNKSFTNVVIIKPKPDKDNR